jgi:hypothetical protein
MVDSERGVITRAPKVGVAIATSTSEAACTPSTPSSSDFTCGSMTSCSPCRRGPTPGVGRRSATASSSRSRSRRCSWASPTTDVSSRSRGYRLAHLFPYLPQQPAYNKRLRALAPRIAQVITHLAAGSASFGDGLRLLDSTPVPCGQSRETALRSELAGSAAYGYCRSHSRYLWGFPLYLLREVAAEFARTRRA